MTYVYRGNLVDVIDHGEPRGYWQHRRLGVPACDACKEARNRARRTTNRRPYRAAKCGTDSGYSKHRREGTPICLPCKVAHSKKGSEYYWRRMAEAEYQRMEPDTRHGTPGGYRKHKRLGSDPCAACKKAHSADSLAYYYRRKEEKEPCKAP
ncbi:hypothetical protein SPF06_00890 [Sinomonas sp. JGH33]|uniref:HNH endonuclease n=1 Tax=Sinomonas terricola TaxID=3110330 RepID=A0ABU5T197_9MICC|nr:hypothetical protein [Sinomonas sp. JGH33]MEA5453266.1 hypothetical protein [Sinomonas sp. JGH33]